MNTIEIADWESIKGWKQHCEFVQSDFTNEKKRQLLKMAEDGSPKPFRKHDLYGVLNSYINNKSTTYDVEFDKRLRSLRPDWFPSNPSIAKKEKLIQMAENGEDMPQYQSSLGMALKNYTNSSADTFDENFDKKIKLLRPDWFRFLLVKVKKEQLLKMANNGESRPTSKNKGLGLALLSYTSKNHDCYDADFDKEIRRLRSDWFVFQSERVFAQKKQLLEMAKNGKSKPKKGNEFYSIFQSYIQKKHPNYDQEFCNELNKINPTWLRTRTQITIETKKMLLKIAKNNEVKPFSTTKIGLALWRYTNKQNESYDAEFDKQIKKLKPDWFTK